MPEQLDMHMIMKAVLGLAIGYVVGAMAGAVAVEMLSTNAHDRSVEMAMTAAFVTGPLGAVIGLVAALVRARRSAT